MSDNEARWVEDNGSCYYYYSNGEMATGWQKLDGDTYYFYDDGSMAWGRTIDGYYVNNDGKWVTSEGWEKNEKGIYYYVGSDEKAATGWENINNNWYYFDDDGKMATGWQNIDGFWYYLYSSGEMATGWTETDNGWYYLYSDGSMTYENTVNGYHLGSSGKMVTGTGWQYVDGSWYYLNDDGTVATNWQYINNNWYYLYPKGSMAWNTTVDGYYLNKDGEWVPNEDDESGNSQVISDLIPSSKVTNGAAVTVTYDGAEISAENDIFTQKGIIQTLANGTVVRKFKEITEFFKFQLLNGMGDNSELGVIYVTDEQEKLADAGADMLTTELGGDFVAIVANGVRAYKNIKTGEIIYNESYFAGSGAGNIKKAASNAGKVVEEAEVTADEISFSDKFSKPQYKNQVADRGWTNESIADTINNPYKTGTSINKYTGNSVKTYYVDDVHYVAVDEVTGKVIQVADLAKPDWALDLTK